MTESTSPRTVAIVQSNYLPWKGYFDLIAASHVFVLYDSVQYTRRDWRNRNRIPTPAGLHWLSIPVHSKGHYLCPIRDMRVSDPQWARRHWTTLRHQYRSAPGWSTWGEPLEALYRRVHSPWLSEINRLFLQQICDWLDITTHITACCDYTLQTGLDPTERLASLCTQTGADIYLSGPSARAYLRPEVWEQAGILLKYMDYSGYPCYAQRHSPFEHGVSVVDLLLQTGARARQYLLCGQAG